MRPALRWLSLLLLSGGLVQPANADTLDDVQARGDLRCGVNGLVPGLSFKDDAGRWSGLDVDFCRAVAAAALGGKEKLELVPLSNAERLTALAEGRVDLISRNTTWTFSRDAGQGISFVGILYHDGQGFMVPRKTDFLSALELSGQTVCALAGTTSAENTKRYFTRHRMELDLRTFDDLDAAGSAYFDGDCGVLTSDQSQLHALRSTLQRPHEHRILPEVVSKEPLGPAVREGDDRWFDIVRWTLFALINAEEMGIDSTNVDRARELAKNEETRLLLDADGKMAQVLGLHPRWITRAIAQVGNYAEIFERNLGDQSPLKIKRGLNALWINGGLLYAPPSR
jgi:general L-amino acid transport system substrate-binding protein